MKLQTVVHFTARFGLAWAVAFSAHGADIYKWVDQNGRTHYSQTQETGAVAKVMGVKASSAAPQTATSTPASVSDPLAPRNRLELQSKSATANGAAPTRGPRSLSGGRIDESTSGKCNLARDVLSGEVRRVNGTPFDAYDREVAANDIRSFCKN
jgi:hypothetical protein